MHLQINFLSGKWKLNLKIVEQQYTITDIQSNSVKSAQLGTKGFVNYR